MRNGLVSFVFIKIPKDVIGFAEPTHVVYIHYTSRRRVTNNNNCKNSLEWKVAPSLERYFMRMKITYYYNILSYAGGYDAYWKCIMFNFSA